MHARKTGKPAFGEATSDWRGHSGSILGVKDQNSMLEFIDGTTLLQAIKEGSSGMTVKTKKCEKTFEEINARSV